MNTYTADIKLSIKTKKIVSAANPLSAQMEAGMGLHKALTLNDLVKAFGNEPVEVSLNSIKCTKKTEDDEHEEPEPDLQEA